MTPQKENIMIEVVAWIVVIFIITIIIKSIL